MNDQILFLNMFSSYQPPESLYGLLSQAVIGDASIDPVKGWVCVDLSADTYISRRQLETVSREVCQIYGLKKLDISIRFPKEQLQNMEPEDLMALFVDENSITRGSLAGASWKWEDETLHIQLLGNGKDELEKCLPKVKQQLFDQFGVSVNIQIHPGENLSGKALFEAMEKMRSSAMQDLPRTVQTEKAPEQKQDSETIYGKPFRGKSVFMDELDLNMGTVIVEGRVFSVEHKELTKRNAWVVKFDMTDNKGSVTVSRFMERKEAAPIIEQIKNGSVIRVQGKLTVDNYTNETVLKPYAIMPGVMEKRRDTAPGEKRVELHLHTNMSSMDALTSTDAAIKQAAAWGHRAIAITDHGCVQAFTDALHSLERGKKAVKVAGTDEDIKVLYGCEGYFVNDVDDRIAVHGTKNIPLTDEYVAFDLETTGLSSHKDTIIEIGAVLMKDGKELDRFQTFVDPKRKLDKKIVDLTGITDQMLRGAPTIDQVLPKFLEFIGDRVLVAHNADFDTGFIRQACKDQGYEYNYTSADTLILSQNLMPQLGKFKLDIVSNALSLPDFAHHRAADDAVTCGLIMDRFVGMLKEMGIQELQQINPAMETLRSQNRIGDRHARHIILFAKNQLGLRNLYHLISDSNLKYYKRVPRIPKSELMKLREGLLIGSACEAGELFQAVIDRKSDEELRRLASFYDFLEIQPLSNKSDRSHVVL